MRSTSARLWSVPGVSTTLGRAATISSLGTAVAALALPLAAALALEASALEMGLLVAIERGPIFIMGLVVGLWIDRRLGRPRMIATDSARAAALLVGPVAARRGRVTIEIVYAVASVIDRLSVSFELASLAYLPSRVRRAQAFDGNSKRLLSEGFTGIAGRGLVGVLVRIAGAQVALLVDWCSFLLSAASSLLRNESSRGGWRRVADHLRQSDLAHHHDPQRTVERLVLRSRSGAGSLPDRGGRSRTGGDRVGFGGR